MHRIDPSPQITTVSNRRPEWRTRLVQAERGFVGGLRSDATLFGHFFGWLVVITAGLVLRLHWQQWIVIGLCLSFALTAELIHQAFRSLLQDREHTPAESRALGLATAAVIVATLGAGAPIATILWQRLHHLL